MAGIDYLVLLQGVGGPCSVDQWLSPINHRLGDFGMPVIDPSLERVLTPTYLDELETPVRPAVIPTDVYRKPAERIYGDAEMEFVRRRSELRTIIRGMGQPEAGWGFDLGMPQPMLEWVTNAAEAKYFPLVRRYRTDATTRQAVQAAVLDQLPSKGRLAIVAHSLGSVVAIDLIRKLPNDVTVELLMTVGGPLALDRMRRNAGSLSKDGFPYDRLRSWVNVWAPQDVVTFGKGLSRKVPAVLDVYAHLGISHDLGAYLRHPAVARVIHHIKHPPGKEIDLPARGQVSRPLHDAWQPVLVTAAFAQQVSRLYQSDEWRSKKRLDTARELIADATMAEIAERRATLDAQLVMLVDLFGEGATRTAEAMRRSPVADGRHPTRFDLMSGAADLLRGLLTDAELVPEAVGLMMQPVVAPYEVKVSDDKRQKALEATLNRVRRQQGYISDGEFASTIRRAVKAAQSDMAEGEGVPWGTVMFVTGAAVLAATGIGLLAAAPAGLAGAAAVTSTLAAFGPGGMVGGIVTLATLTGTGAAFTTAGLLTPDSGRPSTQSTKLRIDDAAADLVNADPEALRATLAAMLATLRVQDDLDFESTRPWVTAILTAAFETATFHEDNHNRVAEDSDPRKVWTRRRRLIGRALEIVKRKALDEAKLTDAATEWLAAIEAGKSELA